MSRRLPVESIAVRRDGYQPFKSTLADRMELNLGQIAVLKWKLGLR